jgi:hypothetical protein
VVGAENCVWRCREVGHTAPVPGRLPGATPQRAAAWQLAAGGDLALPEVPGPRPLPVRVINAYVNRYQTAAENDIVLAERSFRVAGLLEPPARLLRPSTVLRVLAGSLRRRGAGSSARIEQGDRQLRALDVGVVPQAAERDRGGAKPG